MLVVCLFTIDVFSQTYPLRINSSHRYLEDQTGTSFFLNADAAWSLIAQLNYTDANTYLADRQSRQFNGVLVNLIEHKFADHAPANIYNVSPWTGATFATPNDAYFAHADSVISLANQLGIVVMLDPIYLGYNCGDEGWCAEVQSATAADMRIWGAYIGNRYKNYPNIIWVIGGDCNPDSYTDVHVKVDSMMAGLRAADNVYTRIFTTHSERETQAITHWTESWVNFNNIYTDNTNLITYAQSAYSNATTMPFFLIEAYYENEHSLTLAQVRSEEYWTILKGGCGVVFGNCPLWSFGATAATSFCITAVWQSQLSSVGSVSMKYFYNLFNSRRWYKLVPDRKAAVLTAGAQSGTTMAMVAYTTDSSSIIGYLPTQRSVTINPAVLKGDSIRVWWYNPSTGESVNLGTYSKVSRSYIPPSAGDWVIVIDSTAFNNINVGVDLDRDISREFYLQQNYPNPFNPVTNIEYALPHRVHVTLDLYNNLGQLVERLVDKVQDAGYHQAAVDGRNLVSGVYLYRFRAGEFVQTNKLLLLKWP